MIFFADNNGTIVKTLPSPVYQGSAGANNIYLVAPFAANMTVTVAFQLPNGVWTTRAPMTPQQAISGVVNENTGEEYSGWSYSLPNEITQYYGTVTAQFFFYAAQAGVVAASSATSFTVGRGVPEVLPPEPTEDIYAQILSALSSIQSDLFNGTYTARSMQAWRSAYSYGANEIVFYPYKGEYGTFIKSLQENNRRAPYNSDGSTTATWQEVADFNVINELYGLEGELRSGVQAAQASAEGAAQSATQAGASASAAQESATQASASAQEVKDAADYIQGIESGNIAVQKAIADGTGENIAEHFEGIENLIPSSTTPQNQLTNEAFVNSSINNMAAFYITSNAAGDAFPTRASLLNATAYYYGGQPRTPTQNDYAIVLADESQPLGADGKYPTTRYSYQGTAWSFQYVVNNTSLTQAQVDAVNSGITAQKLNEMYSPSNKPTPAAIGQNVLTATRDGTTLTITINE